MGQGKDTRVMRRGSRTQRHECCSESISASHDQTRLKLYTYVPRLKAASMTTTMTERKDDDDEQQKVGRPSCCLLLACMCPTLLVMAGGLLRKAPCLSACARLCYVSGC